MSKVLLSSVVPSGTSLRSGHSAINSSGTLGNVRLTGTVVEQAVSDSNNPRINKRFIVSHPFSMALLLLYLCAVWPLDLTTEWPLVQPYNLCQ